MLWLCLLQASYMALGPLTCTAVDHLHQALARPNQSLVGIQAVEPAAPESAPLQQQHSPKSNGWVTVGSTSSTGLGSLQTCCRQVHAND
jgi:hypothetical protein